MASGALREAVYIYIVYDKSIWYTAGPLSWVADVAYPTANQVARANKDYKKTLPNILGRMEKKDPPSWKMVYETRILYVQ